MISRRALLQMLGLSILSPKLAAAQDAARLPRVVVLSWAPSALSARAVEAGLTSRGQAIGKTIAIELLSAEGRAERLPALAKAAVALEPKVIVAIGTQAAIAARQASSELPIVTVSGDIVAGGLVTNLARPEGNVTGLSFFNSDLVLKRFELLMEVVPKLRRLGALSMAGASPVLQAGLAALTAHTQKRGIELILVTLERIDDLKTGFAKLSDAKVAGMMVMPSPNLDEKATEIGRLSLAHRFIAIFPFERYVQGGGLVCYGPDLADLLYRAGTYADRILRGAKPGDLPVEQPTKFELVINLKTAKALGLTIPQSVLLRADKLIE